MEIDKSSLYEIRLLVFLENEPQSNQYRQVCLNKSLFKKVSDSISEIMSRDGEDEIVEIKISDDIYTLPDLPETYE